VGLSFSRWEAKPLVIAIAGSTATDCYRALFLATTRRYECGTEISGTVGRNTLNVVPERPGLNTLLNRIAPPYFLTMPSDTHNPMPVPVLPLVV